MKTFIRLVLVSAALVGFVLTPALAASSTYNTNSWNTTSTFTQTWYLSTPAATSVSATVQTQVYYHSSGAASSNVTTNGTNVLNVSAGGAGWPSSPMVYNNSGSNSGLPAGDYTVTHTIGGATNTIYAAIATTVSW